MEVAVSRKDLYDSPSEPEAPADLGIKLEIEEIQVEEPGPGNSENPEEPQEEEEFVFNLFSSAVQPTARVSLRSPSPEPYIAPERPRSYYFSDLSDKERESMAQTAISGSEVVAQSTMPWPGMAMPWKVLNVAEYNAKVEKETRKRRPGKKNRLRRIAVRERKVEIQKREKKQRIQQRNHKFGRNSAPQKMKPKPKPKPAQSKPKYRTE